MPSVTVWHGKIMQYANYNNDQDISSNSNIYDPPGILSRRQIDNVFLISLDYRI